MTEDEITQVEKLVNESIAKAYDVDIKICRSKRQKDRSAGSVRRKIR